MTWAGEDPASGIYMFTEDGSPDVIGLGSDGQVLAMSGSIPIFRTANIAAITGHNLLSQTHTDTLSTTPEQGDVIIASGDTWISLPLGPEEYNLTVDNSGVIWFPPRGGLSNASGVQVGDAAHRFSSTTAQTTDTSASGSIMPGMSIAPGSGQYLCIWSATLSSNKAASEIEVVLFVNNSGAPGTLREMEFSAANLKTSSALNGIVTVIDDGSIDIRWRVASGPPSTVAIVYSRDLSIVRVNDKTNIAGI